MRAKRYDVRLSTPAEKDLGRLDKPVLKRILPVIAALADNPRPHGCTALQGVEHGWRIVIGPWRVLYTVEDAVVTVMVFRVQHRREVYR